MDVQVRRVSNLNTSGCIQACFYGVSKGLPLPELVRAIFTSSPLADLHITPSTVLEVL